MHLICHNTLIPMITPETAAKFLPIVQAMSEGKAIQYQDKTGCWRKADNIIFCSSPESYRVKPEPREWTLYRPAGCSDLIAYDKPISSWANGIRVREILD